MRVHKAERIRLAPRSARAIGMLLIAVGAATQAGCGREFFREWANQDASEAIFEKTRDPRWRLELFSYTPPMMSRFADPSDPDNPPAPPDDFAAEALSPVPQAPNNRFLVPLEGTGYLKMLDQWQREKPIQDVENLGGPVPNVTMPPGMGRPDYDPGPTNTNPPADDSPFRGRQPQLPPAPPLPPAPNPPTSRPSTNSGTTRGSLTPISRAGSANGPLTDREIAAAVKNYQSKTQRRNQDSGVVRTSVQQSTGPAAGTRPPMTTPAPATATIPAPTSLNPRQLPPPVDRPAGEQLRTPRVPQDPDPSDADLSRRVNPRPDLDPMQREAVGELEALLGPRKVPFYEADAAGLPRDSRPYVINMEQAFTLSLLNSRIYQFRLENLYLAALPVTLNRFTFTPQFIAGMSPSTGILGPAGIGGIAPASNPGNSFLYRTRETGSQLSQLNLGTVAGVGKVFDNGGKILASFASQIVFNFTGARPSQPTVQSAIPIQIVQPFLKGAGRAVTLETLTQAERGLLYEARVFAKFRQEFVVAVLVGGQAATAFGTSAQVAGFSGGGNGDSVIGFLNVVEDLQAVENDVKNVAAYDNFYKVYQELMKGESSGLAQLQVDQIDQNRQNARQNLLRDQLTFRNDIDQFKMQMGLPPDVPMVVDRSLTRPFQQVFEDIDTWSRNPRRELSELDAIAARLPRLDDLIIEGRSCLRVANDLDNNLEDLLLAAERVALENRLDLMNARANLYDTWRQIRIAANGLKGIFNVTLTNQVLTPPNTTNPFGFVDQAKNFSLVFNTELPLVRMTERNAFVTALINYQRARRNLMQIEDQLKYVIRNSIRNLQQQYRTYEIARRNYVLSVRQKDQSFENIIAPPAGTAGNTQGAVQTQNLIQAQNGLIQQQNQLLANWLQYQQTRLQLFRDLGIMPYDEWEAFYEFFPAARKSTDGSGDFAAGPGTGGGGPGN